VRLEASRNHERATTAGLDLVAVAGQELIDVAGGPHPALLLGRGPLGRGVRAGPVEHAHPLEIATGRVTGHCLPRHRHHEFLRFLRQITRAYPRVELHLVMDNYAAHKHSAVRAWLAANPRVQVHFTPTSASWLNVVECWFSIIERQAIHRGSYASVPDLNRRIRGFIDGLEPARPPVHLDQDR
jgi:hypothetical protein